jgi:hypothetical protein
MTKRIGPNLVPFGTPALVESHRDTHCPSLTHWRRFERKLQIQGIIERRTPKSINFVITILWSILSKALLKSRKQALR